MRQEINIPSTSQKVLAVGFTTVFLGMLAGVGYVFGQAADGLPPALVPVLLAVPALFVVYLALGTVRGAAWLEGTDLVVRSALATRRADLAKAPVRIGTRQLYKRVSAGEGTTRVPAGRMPQLRAQTPTGRWVRVDLRNATGDLMARGTIEALRDAIASGTRLEPEQSEAKDVAEALSELADNPVYRLM
jgi:hypothetical protein